MSHSTGKKKTKKAPHNKGVPEPIHAEDMKKHKSKAVISEMQILIELLKLQ